MPQGREAEGKDGKPPLSEALKHAIETQGSRNTTQRRLVTQKPGLLGMESQGLEGKADVPAD